MSESPRSTGSIRSRAMSAALVSLGCSLGVSITPAMLAADSTGTPPTAVSANHIKLDANQQKVQTALEAALTADQIKLANFEKSLTPEARRLPVNQEKIHVLQTAVKADQHKLQANHIKLEVSQQK